MFNLCDYKGKKVMITGHTGFKGSWMCQVLLGAGADILGYALEPPTVPSLFEILKLSQNIHSLWGDIRDYNRLYEAVKDFKPEFVIHMAAQPIVRESYKNPVYTYETNVLGTVNILEAVRNTESVRSFVNVTTDKVYLNREWEWGYRENEELNGHDPYSNSKSCSELVTSSYRRSFFENSNVAISTVRAGNVVGGGDFAADRIIPDCVRAAKERKEIIIRNPYSVRPYQHVLEPIMAYLMIAMKQYQNKSVEGAYNVGPQEENCITTEKMADIFCNQWEKVSGLPVKWKEQGDGGPHEAKLLKLDCASIRETFGWHPVWKIEETIEAVVEWYYFFSNGQDVQNCTDEQIGKYLNDVKGR